MAQAAAQGGQPFRQEIAPSSTSLLSLIARMKPSRTSGGKEPYTNLRAGERTTVPEHGLAEKNYWADLWAYPEPFAILAWREVAVKYKQTVIGVAWAVVRPLLTMLTFTVVFGPLAKLPRKGQTPYPVLVVAGLQP